MGDDTVAMMRRTGDPEYYQIKSRMDSALIFLRKELIQMRAHDEALLKQLLQIHDKIASLSGTRTTRRQSCGSQMYSKDTSCLLNRSFPIRQEVGRRLSAPPDADHLSDEGVDTDDKSLEEDAFDSQSHDDKNRDSFGSLDEIDLDLEKEMADYLSPLPHTLTDGRRNSRNGIKKKVRIAENNNHLMDNKNNLAGKYEISYGELLRRSSKLFKDVQREKKETGFVDQRKMAALKLFL